MFARPIMPKKKANNLTNVSLTEGFLKMFYKNAPASVLSLHRSVVTHPTYGTDAVDRTYRLKNTEISL